MNLARRLTAPGVGAVGVIRLSGPAVAGFLARRFSMPARRGVAVHGELSDDAGRIDDGLLVAAETFADLSLHGGDWVMRRALRLAESEGFASTGPADASETSDELLTARVLALLPHATSPLAVRTLLAQPRLWSEDVAAVAPDDAISHLIHPPTVAILGHPNVGKSTLANQLFAAERSVVADAPGTTRDWVGELADVCGLVVRLIDTPGRRVTRDAIEAEAIDRSREVVEAADLRLWIADATRPETALGRNPGDRLVWNKADLVPARDGLAVSAVRGDGLDALRAAVVVHFLGSPDVEARRCRLPHG
jgi:tRNA modification GTPase